MANFLNNEKIQITSFRKQFWMAEDLTTGTKFDNDEKYTVFAKAGEGGNASCFLLINEDRFYCLKVAFSTNDTKLIQEAQMMQNFANATKVAIFETSDEEYNKNNPPWYLMDYIPGITLSSLVFEEDFQRFATNENILRIFLITLIALDGFFRYDFVHRDIKPENIMIDCDIIPHVIDWGESNTLQDGARRSTMNEHGTIPYAAPEVYRGEATTATDMFSYGATIFHVITGEFRFQPLYSSEEGVREFETLLYSGAKTYNVGRDLFEDLKDLHGQEQTPETYAQICDELNNIMPNLIKQGFGDSRYDPGTENFNRLNPFQQKMMTVAHYCMDPDETKRPRIDEVADMLLDIAGDPQIFPNASQLRHQMEAMLGEEPQPAIYGTAENVQRCITECGFGKDTTSPLYQVAKTYFPEALN